MDHHSRSVMFSMLYGISPVRSSHSEGDFVQVVAAACAGMLI